MTAKKSILLMLILTAAGSFLNLYAAETAVDLKNWSESVQIFTLDNDYPEYRMIQSLDGLPGKELKSWTSQLRVAGFAALEDGVIIAVNAGYPLVFTTGSGKKNGLSSPSKTTVRKFMDYSADLTTGTVFSENGRVFFHLYRDDFFNAYNSSSDDSSGHPVILEFSPDASGGYSVDGIDYDFHEKNPEWEPVEYLRKDGESIVAWKYSDEKKTRFRYIRHGERGESIDEIDESFFRDEYSLKSFEDGSFALRGFIQAAREGSAGLELFNAGDVYLRLSTVPEGVSEVEFPIYYYSPAPKPVAGLERKLPVQLQACSDGELWYILSGSEVLFCGANISRWSLPELPEGFVYEELWVKGRDMIVSWEERRFPFIGHSGMMYIRLRDIIN